MLDHNVRRDRESVDNGHIVYAWFVSLMQGANAAHGLVGRERLSHGHHGVGKIMNPREECFLRPVREGSGGQTHVPVAADHYACAEFEFGPRFL